MSDQNHDSKIERETFTTYNVYHGGRKILDKTDLQGLRALYIQNNEASADITKEKLLVWARRADYQVAESFDLKAYQSAILRQSRAADAAAAQLRESLEQEFKISGNPAADRVWILAGRMAGGGDDKVLREEYSRLADLVHAVTAEVAGLGEDPEKAIAVVASLRKRRAKPTT